MRGNFAHLSPSKAACRRLHDGHAFVVRLELTPLRFDARTMPSLTTARMGDKAKPLWLTPLGGFAVCAIDQGGGKRREFAMLFLFSDNLAWHEFEKHSCRQGR